MNTTDEEAVIEIKPGKNTCCPEKTLHVTCIGCGTDYGGIVEYTEKEVRLAEERGKIRLFNELWNESAAKAEDPIEIALRLVRSLNKFRDKYPNQLSKKTT